MNKKETEKKSFFDDTPEESSKKNEKIFIVPFKKIYLKIFKGENYYLLDRLKYDVNTIMMLLDLNRLNKLADFYKDYPDGIEKVKFVEGNPKIVFYLKKFQNDNFILEPNIDIYKIILIKGKDFKYILDNNKLYRCDKNFENTVIKLIELYI